MFVMMRIRICMHHIFQPTFHSDGIYAQGHTPIPDVEYFRIAIMLMECGAVQWFVANRYYPWCASPILIGLCQIVYQPVTLKPNVF